MPYLISEATIFDPLLQAGSERDNLAARHSDAQMREGLPAAAGSKTTDLSGQASCCHKCGSGSMHKLHKW
jgi:hypothetical protein